MSDQTKKVNPTLLYLGGVRKISWPVLLSSARKYLTSSEFGSEIRKAEQLCDRMRKVITLQGVDARLHFLENILREAISNDWENDMHTKGKSSRLHSFMMKHGDYQPGFFGGPDANKRAA